MPAELELMQPVSLAEAGAVFDHAKREIVVRPIRPGFGNKRDGFYYPKAVLKEAVQAGLFNNRKMFADHPTRDDDNRRPERSVWDWVSTMKETWWDEATDEPRSRVKVYDDRFWDRAVAAPDEIAFSILGNGLARPGIAEGRQARVVEALATVRSVDWVTEAGAGGAILAFAESAHEELEMDLSKLTIEQLKEARPDLIAAMREEDEDAAEDAADEGAEDVADETVADEGTEDAAEPEDESVEDAAEDESEEDEEEAVAESDEAFDEDVEDEQLSEAGSDFVTRAEFEQVVAKLRESEAKEARAAAKAKGKRIVEKALADSTLPAFAKEQVKARFTEAGVGDGFEWPDDETLRQALKNDLKFVEQLMGSLGGRKNVTSIGDASTGIDLKEAVAQDILGRWGTDPIPMKETGSADESSDDSVSVSESAKAVETEMAASFGDLDS